MKDLAAALDALERKVEGRSNRPVQEQFYFYMFGEQMLAIDDSHPKGEKYLWNGAFWTTAERIKF